MAGIHQTRHQLCNKRTCKSTSTTIKDQKKLRHLVRYLAGTKGYKFSIRPTIKLYDNTPQQLDLNIYVDSDGPEVIKGDEAQQALSSNYSALASTLNLEHKQW